MAVPLAPVAGAAGAVVVDGPALVALVEEAGVVGEAGAPPHAVAASRITKREVRMAREGKAPSARLAMPDRSALVGRVELHVDVDLGLHSDAHVLRNLDAEVVHIEVHGAVHV